MKKIIWILIIMLVLTSCQKDDRPVLRVYNWGEYISRYALREFEKEYNVKVQYDVFSSNEYMYTKLASESYDVLVPSDYMIQRLIEEDKLLKLDKSLIPNMGNIDKKYLNRNYDKNNDYAVPYFVGSVGLVYNSNNISQEKIEKLGWEILLDSTYTNNIFFYNSERDGFMVALKTLGYSMNTENESELKEAFEWLVSMKKSMNPIYVDDYVIDAMISEEKDIAIMYSGDAAYAEFENENLKYLEPYQGTNIWIDAMVISKDAKEVELAHAFINYILKTEVSEDISYEVGYTTPNKDAFNNLSNDEHSFKGIDAYIPRSDYHLDEEFYYNKKNKALTSELWSKVMASE